MIAAISIGQSLACGRSDSFVLDTGKVTKIYQQTKVITSALKVIHRLGPMFGDQLRNCFDLDDDLSKAYKIRLVIMG